MKNAITFSVEKIITVLMIVVAVGVFGVVSFTRLTTDLFPDINLPYAVVTTTYPGASPEEVEQDVTVPLERAFQTTTNISEVTTQSHENFSLVILEFTTDTAMDSATIEMREQLNNLLDNLPDDASNPNIMRLNPNMLPIMNFSVSHQGKDIEELTEWVDDTLTPELERIGGVASLNISGGYESEVRVTLDQDEIDAINNELEVMLADFEDMIDEDEFGGSLEEGLLNKEFISGVLQAQNFSFPAGFVEMEDTSHLVRVGDAFESMDEMRTLKILDIDLPLPGADPVQVHLEDVAHVDFIDHMDRQYSKVNGENAMSISLQKGSEYATTDVTAEVNDTLTRLSDEEDGFEYTMLLDQGEYIEQATGSVTDNLLIGGLLAVFILLVFLRSFRITFIVGVAIPISLLFAIVLVYLSGITLNIVSLGGLALGIGMLVDNSIVVIENIFRLKKEGHSNKEAAINGAHQVAGAIIASTLTTIGVFLPIMFIEDFIREIFYQLALTITFSLLASLLIALTFVPTVANRIMKADESASVKRTNDKQPFMEKVKNAYSFVLNGLFKVKSVVMITVFVLFGGAVLLATSRGFEFFPATDEGTLMITLEPSEGESAMAFQTLSDNLDALGDDLLEYQEVESVGITVGGDGLGMMGGQLGSTEQTTNVNLVLSDDRERTTQVMNDVIGTMIEADYPMFEADIIGTEGDMDQIVGSGVQVRVSGNDLDLLREEADSLTALLSQVNGIEHVDPGYDAASQEIRITVDKDAAIEVGLTNAQVLQIVSEYLSEPSVVMTLQSDNRSYDVYVYDEEETTRQNIEDLGELEALVVGETLMGETVALSDIADVEMAPGFTTINRFNGARNIVVDAQLESGANATLVAEDVETVLDDYEAPSGVELTLMGESEEIQETLETMLLIGAIGIMLVYMIMASQFQSFIYPFIIMITIPLAFTGGFGLLYLSGDPVSIIALIGLVILSGVVVNNGIVLVDYINQLRERGLGLKAAIFQAGRVRLRPIFMTALTTILALTGMAFGLGEGAELIQPLAFTAIGGLVYATLLTIFVVPIMYYALSVYTRYIIGGFFILVVLLSAWWLYSADMVLLAGAALLGVVVIGLMMAFVPKQPIETQSTQTVDAQAMDEYLKRILN